MEFIKSILGRRKYFIGPIMTRTIFTKEFGFEVNWRDEYGDGIKDLTKSKDTEVIKISIGI